MGTPYRSKPTTTLQTGPRDTGIASDIIAQFADTLAFLRELVQNSMDAETPRIDVSIRHDESRQVVVVAVKDQGIGMSRQILEEQLLVLFRSTKEQDDEKIGKFGIGFISVLAVQPSLVKVVTSQEGIRHTLHLYPDLSYELFETGRSLRSFTEVEIEIPIQRDAVAGFTASCLHALRRWCRHARVHIVWTVYDRGGGTLAEERIDRPLALDNSLVSVRLQSRDGTMQAIVGLTETRVCSFFNHGLLLYETSEALAGPLSFVLQDAGLGHTLSRDNVRHDQNYHNALSLVTEAQPAVLAAMIQSMSGCLSEGDEEGYASLCQIGESISGVSRVQWPLPVFSAGGSSENISLQEFVFTDRWCSESNSPCTQHLVTLGHKVVNMGAVPADSDGETWLHRSSVGLRKVNEELTLFEPLACSGSDFVLLQRLETLFGKLQRKPAGIVLAAFSGAQETHLYAAGRLQDAYAYSDENSPWIFNREQAQCNPFRLFRRPLLLLNTNHSYVALAREKGTTDPVVAAHALARLVLLSRNKLDPESSQQLLELGLSEALEGRNGR